MRRLTPKLFYSLKIEIAMRTIPIALVCLTLLFTVPASALTLNEISEMQAALQKAELEKKLAELRQTADNLKQQSASAAEVQRDPTLTLKGVYGLGKRLFAIVSVGGAEVEFAAGDTYFGYRAVSIEPNEAVLVKLDAKTGKSGAAGKTYRLRLTSGSEFDSVMNALRNLMPPLPGVSGVAGVSGVRSGPVMPAEAVTPRRR
jgi:type IV pilus biogenesis protein PilP